VTGIDSLTLKKLMDYPWPGNVREMQNVLEYALHIAEDNHTITDQHLPPKFQDEQVPVADHQRFISIEEHTKKVILAMQNEYNEEDIANVLGISRKNLWEKRKRWDLNRPIK
jgi:transcriptional regulator with PAS, ATPase and Fis domain